MTNEKSYNCLSTIPPSLQIWQGINLMLKDPTNQVMWSSDHVVTWKIKKLLSAFQEHRWQPNLAEQRLRLGTPCPKSCERLTKWLRGHYLLNVFKASVQWLRGHYLLNVFKASVQWLRGHYWFNVFKASVPIILKILSLLSVVLLFLDDKIILIRSYLTLRRSPP